MFVTRDAITSEALCARRLSEAGGEACEQRLSRACAGACDARPRVARAGENGLRIFIAPSTFPGSVAGPPQRGATECMLTIRWGCTLRRHERIGGGTKAARAASMNTNGSDPSR